MKNKICILSTAGLASLALLACGGGGSKPTVVTEKDIEVSFKDPSAEFYFGDKIYQDDLQVKLNYSDGTSKILTNDKFEAVQFTPKIEVATFPIPLEFSIFSNEKSITIRTKDGAHYKTFKFNVDKQYYFKYDSEAWIDVYYSNPSKFSFTNTLLAESGTNITYKSSNTSEFTVDESSGVVTAIKPFDEFTRGSVISAYVDGIRVDQYQLQPVDYPITKTAGAVTVDSNTIKATTPGTTYDPNESHKLYIPGIYDGNRITTIAKEGFVGCTQIQHLNFSENITTIQEGAFSGCSGIGTSESPSSHTVRITKNITHIGANAFKGVNKECRFRFEDTENWHYSYYEGEELKYGDIDAEILEDDYNATKMLTDENYCGCTFFKL